MNRASSRYTVKPPNTMTRTPDTSGITGILPNIMRDATSAMTVATMNTPVPRMIFLVSRLTVKNTSSGASSRTVFSSCLVSISAASADALADATAGFLMSAYSDMVENSGYP